MNATAVLRRVATLTDLVLRKLDDARAAVAAMPAGEHPHLGAFVEAIRE